ncbi:butyryl-CoA:acetate CoA-transferase [Peptoanaerobacter stomatis]|uniref:Butyryl-CoA:acetate CoA-transferase n=1 Tax=Peptoanaerobacter stomatis TaxID=796937 RepID=J5WHD3_9FIRM|nr:butyryl-CoA:acetate CoA-transferase [Peptoanaerobacter stomatis]EHL17212.1 butyryl-CoA:acetate CoA-transferase [Peptoanaerobacter stomatis]EJU21972.1 butyryl-CoA:acetate CoA-transferase [Peptoanaerobacter stomatis]NWO24817.1 butyryl-CoA:acetate CoA-transferase [Peptostreptococcaceae bacterium oral taxon 081]
MDYSKQYKEKLVTAEKAAELVKSGDWVDYGWCVGTAYDFDKALAKRVNELKDVNLRGGVIFWEPEVIKADETGEHFTWNSWHCSGIERKMASNKRAFYIPLRYSEMPRYYRENPIPVDVAVMQVTPMDKHGFFNFGPNASHMMALIESSKKVVVEVNKNMPRCLGGFESEVHISKVDYIIEGSNTPIAAMKAGSYSEVDIKVANMIVEEIPNGACLQLGIGGMPNAVGSVIADSDLKDLGVHTEMYVDAFVEMTEKGKITGAKKNIDRFRQTYAFGAGTKAMYDFMDDNPMLMSAPVDYTNDARIIASLDNFISINNAVDVDLFGQVSSESSGTKHISGAGGQLDFVLGAYLSNGGKSFICLSSTVTDKEGKMTSRIIPTLKEGSAVTAARPNTHYVVTEYGKVNLKGLSTWQRAEALINIAHPDFREELIKDAEKMKIWRKSNK